MAALQSTPGVQPAPGGSRYWEVCNAARHTRGLHGVGRGTRSRACRSRAALPLCHPVAAAGAAVPSGDPPGAALPPQAADQVHGNDSVMSYLHEGEQPALREARLLLEPATRTVYGLWALGQRVCGHPGITHGGISAFTVDELCGQAYVAWFWSARGPAFTANLNIDYKAPLPASSFVLITVTVEQEEGRKIWFKARVTDGPGGTLFLEARCLFVVARRDDGAMSSAKSMAQLAEKAA